MPILRFSGDTNLPPARDRPDDHQSDLTASAPPAGDQRSVVVLPQPLGPSKVNNSPLRTSKETPHRARTSPLAPAKTFSDFARGSSRDLGMTRASLG